MEILSFEMLGRRLQMWEQIYGEQLQEVTNPSEAGGINSDEKRFFLGQDRLRNRSLVCPELEEYISQCMQQRTQLLKERRKAREESSKGAGKGDGGGPKRNQKYKKDKKEGGG